MSKTQPEIRSTKQ